MAKGPSPASILEHEEGRQRLLNALPDDHRRQMAEWKMQGFTYAEIGENLGISVKSVERGIKLIRKIWAGYVRKNWQTSVRT
jgi:DNA-directed RNA polymerase specialized sigma24 family protein